jgi:glycosyltransferase involved in cell wall biosynthesis
VGTGPTLGVIVTVFHRTRFYREALASIAAQTGPLPPVEIVVVRSPDVEIGVPDRFNTPGWTCRVIRGESVGEGPFFAEGLRHLTSEFVVPLDDDDLWEPGRLRAVTAALRAHPGVGYYHNGQRFVDENGTSVPPHVGRQHLRRFSGAPNGRPTRVTTGELRRHPGGLARWGSMFNNSSVAVRRADLERCAPFLADTEWLLDAFLFYAAAASGSDLLFDPTPWTAYRIHAWNWSRGARTLGAFGTSEPSRSRAGRLSSVAALRAMVGSVGAGWLDPWLDRERAYLDVLEGLRDGESDRIQIVARAARLGRYLRYNDPVMNVVLSLIALGQAASPQAATRAYWGESSPAATGSAGR